MAISFLQTVASSWASTYATSRVITFSATPTSGNFLFTFIHVDGAIAPTITIPSGWTSMAWPSYASSLDPVYLQGMYKISDGTETGFTIVTNFGCRLGVICVEFSGVDAASPVASNDVYMASVYTGSTRRGFAYDMGTFAASADTSYVLRGSACNDDGDGGVFDIGTPSGYTPLSYIENSSYGGIKVTAVSSYVAGDSVANASLITESLAGGEVDAVETGSVGLRAAGSSPVGRSALRVSHIANAIRLQPNYKW